MKRPPVRWGRRPLLVGLVVLIGSSVPARAATPQQVDAALKRGAAFLWSRQQPVGNWEPDSTRKGEGHDYGTRQGDTWGGYSALATYALLSAGEKRQDPRMVRAVNFLRTADIVGTYALGLRCQVWYLLPPTPETRRLMQEDAARLISGLGVSGNAIGMWDYLSGPKWVEARKVEQPRFDHSASQYGVLGLWAAADGGAAIPISQWKTLDHAWRFHQNNNGAWSYTSLGGDDTSGSVAMTAAGVATLFITHDMLGPAGGGFCHGNQVDPSIDRGIQWMISNWGLPNDGYALFGVERIGAASGLKYFGKYDWYAEGSDLLIKRQHEDGSWLLGGTGSTAITETAFAMLFLSHGRAPVLISKLNYAITDEVPRTPPGVSQPAASSAPAIRPATTTTTTTPTTDPVLSRPWNQRPRDVANLVHQMRGSLEQSYLNWQIVTLGTPLDELHEGPVLFISGNRELEFTPAQEARLKQFVQEGGLILANTDCPEGDNELFTQSVRSIFERLFGYKFRPLPANHPILAEQQFKSTRWKDPPVVLGLSNGVREFVLLCPTADPGKSWQKDAFRTEPTAFELGANICLYAVDKQNLQYKGQTYLVKPTGTASSTLHVARLEVGGNWNPEPAGWWRMDAICRNGSAMAVSVAPVVPTTGKLDGYNVAHLTGTTAFQFTPEQRQEVMRFVSAGGTLVIDAAGGSPQFADAAEKELAAMYGGKPAEAGELLDPADRLYNLKGVKIESVDYRPYMRRRTAGKLDAPRIRGIKVQGRLAVFYSREDLSAGMVGQPVDGVTGYTPESATAIMRNILLYAAGAK